MSLNDQMKSMSKLFTSGTFFGEKVIYYRRGESANRKVMNVVVDAANVIGSREAVGDGVVNDEESQYSIRESITLEIPTSLSDHYSRTQESERPDIVIWEGRRYAAKRIIGEDAGMITMLCVRNETKQVRFPKRSG